MTTETIVADAIARSAASSETVRLACDSRNEETDLCHAFAIACDENAESEGARVTTYDYWGTTAQGAEWRVQVSRRDAGYTTREPGAWRDN